MEQRTTLIGTVLGVVFQNKENGYTVLRVVTEDGELVTAVGCIPCAAPGEELVMTGVYSVHPQYGEQFSAEEVERHMPRSETDILSFLAAGTIPGIGPATAQRLVDRFGAETLDVIEGEPEKLSTLKGITAKRAREIAESFREQMGLRRLLEFFTARSLPLALAMQLYRSYGAGAMEALRTNPYILVGDRFGVDFSVADELALAMDFGDASCRTEGGVLFELTHNETNGGHVFLPRGKLVAATAQLLDESEEAVEMALDDLIERGKIVCETIANVEACYLARCHAQETYVAGRFLAMLHSGGEKLRGAARAIDAIEREQGVTYAPLQRRAVELAAEERLLLITGGPGTGKTTSLRGVVALFERMGLEIQLAAPTGRAAKRLGEVTNREAQTIHRLLGMGYDAESGEVKFKKNEKDPLAADALILDETSMLDLALAQALLAALGPGCRLVLVGDPDQLPSVGAGNVFGDLIRSEKIATVALHEVFRQAEKSAIVRNAHRVNAGLSPELQGGVQSDFFFLPRRDSTRLVETVTELCKTRLPEKMAIPADEIQVLSPTRKGDCGTAALNRALQGALNPRAADKKECMVNGTLFREGDRVIQTRNNYDVPWQREDGTAGLGIFNGDVGKIVQIEAGGELVTIAFDERTALYSGEMLAELELAYAITVHKAQGSEYRGVVFVCAPMAPGLMARGVLYTGITRARELLVAVGDDGVIEKMTKNDKQARRYSGLRRRLMGE